MRMIAAFEKTDRVRHIGHLDLMRAIQRALRRSGLPIRYSQGFNPHVALSFAAPLSVGMSGREELMDVGMDGDVDAETFVRLLSPAMPASLPLGAVRAVDDRHPKLMAMLRTASYETLLAKGDASRKVAQAVPEMLALPEIIAIRKTKSGEKPCDIRPMIHTLRAEETPEGFRLCYRVSLTERETLKPALLLETLAQKAGEPLPESLTERICLYGEKDRLPVCLMEC